MTRHRHKGAKPVDLASLYVPYGPNCPVARMIATGNNWFDAWRFQFVTRRKLAIPADRVEQLRGGAPVLASEIATLAAHYGVPAKDIIASLPSPDLLVSD